MRVCAKILVGCWPSFGMRKLRGQQAAVGGEGEEVGSEGGVVLRVHGKVEFEVEEELDFQHVEVPQLDASDLGPVVRRWKRGEKDKLKVECFRRGSG